MTAYALGLSAVAALPLQLLWLKPSDGKQFSYADIAGERELFWLVLVLFRRNLSRLPAASSAGHDAPGA